MNLRLQIKNSKNWEDKIKSDNLSELFFKTEHHKLTVQRQVFPLYAQCLCGVSVSPPSRGQHEVWFCPSGPSDIHIHWLINGLDLNTPIMEHRQPLGQREVLVSSWFRRGPLTKDARYRCVAEASTGRDMSELDLRLTVGGIWTWCCVAVKMHSMFWDCLISTTCIWVLKPGSKILERLGILCIFFPQ